MTPGLVDQSAPRLRADPIFARRGYSAFFFFLPGRMFISLQMMPSITSSAPPPIESRRVSRKARDAGLSHMKPMPPQYCRQASATSRVSLPHLSLAIEASLVTSLPLTYSAVELYISGKDVTKLASMAKLKCGRLSREVTDSCLQYWGGMGYTMDNPISQAFRDSRLISIGGGADEVMLGIICKLEGTLPGKSL